MSVRSIRPWLTAVLLVLPLYSAPRPVRAADEEEPKKVALLIGINR